MNDAFSARGPLLPLLVLAFFGAVLPAALPGASGANDEQCVTLADAPSHRPLDTLPRLGYLLLKKGMALDAAHQAELALRIQPNRRALVDLLQSASVAASGAAE